MSGEVTTRSSRSVWAILRANLFTRFNAIIGTLLVVVLIFGPPQDGLFGLVILVNSAVKRDGKTYPDQQTFVFHVNNRGKTTETWVASDTEQLKKSLES